MGGRRLCFVCRCDEKWLALLDDGPAAKRARLPDYLAGMAVSDSLPALQLPSTSAASLSTTASSTPPGPAFALARLPDDLVLSALSYLDGTDLVTGVSRACRWLGSLAWLALREASSLDLSAARALPPGTLARVLRRLSAAAVQPAPRLTRLLLPPSAERWDAGTTAMVAALAPALESLSLGAAAAFPGAAARAVAACSPASLRRLSLRGGQQASRAAARLAWTTMGALEALDAADCSLDDAAALPDEPAAGQGSWVPWGADAGSAAVAAPPPCRPAHVRLGRNGFRSVLPPVLSPRLVSLGLDGCRSLLPETFSAVLERCPALERLSLAGCATLAGRVHDALGCLPRLRALDVSGVPLLGRRQLVTVRPALALETLVARGCGSARRDLAHLSRAFPALRALDLEAADLEDSDVLRMAAGGGALARLAEVNLGGNLRLTDRSVDALAAAAPALRAVHVEGNGYVASLAPRGAVRVLAGVPVSFAPRVLGPFPV